MDLKLDLTKAVKIVIAKDETHHVEYIIDNGEIKDVNLIEIDNSPEKSCDKKAVELDPPVNNPEYNDRYFIDKAVPLAEKIVRGRNMVATVQDGMSDTSNPEALHNILKDGTTDGKEKASAFQEIENNREVADELKNLKEAWKEKWINEQSNSNAVSMDRSKKLMELVKNGDIDKRVKKQKQGGIPKIIYNAMKGEK